MGKVPLAKYVDTGNPSVTVCIGKIQISNVLVDLGASINVMTIETLKKLGWDVIGIFYEMVNDCMEVFMDDFTPYVNSFDEALENLEKVLKRCEKTHLSLRIEKCHMMMSEGVVLGHFISVKIFLFLGRRKR